MPANISENSLDLSSLFSQIASHQKNWWSFVNFNGQLSQYPSNQAMMAHFRAALMLYCLSNNQIMYESGFYLKEVPLKDELSVRNKIEKKIEKFNLRKIYQNKEGAFFIGPEGCLEFHLVFSLKNEIVAIAGDILSIRSSVNDIELTIKECFE